MFTRILPLLCAILLSANTFAAPPSLDEFLAGGRIAEGLQAYESPDDDGERFSLAILQVLGGLQQYSTEFSRLGLQTNSPLIGLPFVPRFRPNNKLASPEAVTPEKAASLFRNLRTALRQANRTLTKMDGEDFGVEVNLTAARVDFDGDGFASDNESLAAIGGRMTGARGTREQGENLVVRFDRADAAWLKGYTHFLTGFLEILMAYDWKPVWDQSAHLVFLNPEPRPPFNKWAAPSVGFESWADLIATLHEMRLPVVDRKALPRAIDEFRSMFASSRVCWKLVLGEADNDKEWLPSPSQIGPGGATIAQEQIDAWLLVLDELDAVANGKKLMPHWRVKSGAGINMAKFAASPPPFDLVMWIHGGAMLPFLEEGPVSDSQSWETLTQPFGGEFFNFAVWSN